MAYTVKLTDGGANTLTFYVDSYEEEDIDLDSYTRTTDGSMKHYTVTSKKRFVLGVNNIENSDKTTLKTIYDLRTTLEFYKDSAAAKTADVVWSGNFNLHTPTNKSRQFLSTLWQGSITLEEV